MNTQIQNLRDEPFIRANVFAALQRREEFMGATKGLNPYKTSRILDRANGDGVTWRGSSKKAMAASFAVGDYSLWQVTAKRLVELRQEMYP